MPSVLPKFAIVGAFDRFNYGDLLFPLITRRVFHRLAGEFDFAEYALTAADFRSGGGTLTRPLAELYARGVPDGSVVFVSGGDVVGTRWRMMHANFTRNAARKLYAGLSRIPLASRAIDSLIARKYRMHTQLPWIIEPPLRRTGVRVVYDTVGGSALGVLPREYREKLAEQIETAANVSVRDSATLDSLRSLGVRRSITLVPDSALLMSEYFPADTLPELSSSRLNAAMRRLGDTYIAVQINNGFSATRLRELAAALETVSRTLGLPLLLLPIGTAPGHDDHLALRRLDAMLRAPRTIHAHMHVFDIMHAIASARLFIGSSLHGCVTALAYAVPFCGITAGVPKLRDFLRDWTDSSGNEVAAIPQLPAEASRVLAPALQTRLRLRDDLVRRVLRHYAELQAMLT